MTSVVHKSTVLPCAAVLAACLSVNGTARAARIVQSDLPTSLGSSRLVAETLPQRTITVALVLPLRDAAGAAVFVSHATHPGDPLYRQFLTPHQFANRFGANPADYHAVAAWATSQGLTLGEESLSHTILSVTGTVAQIEAAFGLRLNDYRASDGSVFYAADRAPTLPDTVAPAVGGIVGLSSRTHFAPLMVVKPSSTRPLTEGNGPNGAFNASDLRIAYTVPPQSPSAPTETLAVFEQGGYFQSDVSKYLSKNKLPAVKVTPRLVNTYGGGVNDLNIELEAVLDIDMEIAINPAAKQVLVYEDGDDSFGVALLDSLSAMANDDRAQTISISYGTDEAIQGVTQIAAEGQVLVQLAAQGQQVFASAGDNGAYNRAGTARSVSDPASQPYVTSVGGTTLFTSNKELFVREEVWNLLGTYDGATGGGVSTYWPIPNYQFDAVNNPVATANGGSSTFRNVPDVAAVGNPVTGVAVYSEANGGWLTIGGTSASSPIWAGFYSLLNAANKGLGLGQVGFFNPSLYSLSEQPFASYFDENDIQDGSNGNAPIYGIAGFNAGPGYDNTTGWGSPVGAYFLRNFVLDPFFDGSNPPAAPTDLRSAATATIVTLRWHKVDGALGYAVLGAGPNNITSSVFTQGDSGTVTGLTPNTLYAFSIYAVNKTGETPNQIYVKTAK